MQVSYIICQNPFHFNFLIDLLAFIFIPIIERDGSFLRNDMELTQSKVPKGSTGAQRNTKPFV